MARYRKIDVRIWVDDKFMNLSTPCPSAQHLWFYLLTNPDTVNVPGLYRCGEQAIAEALRWPLKGFRKVFFELEREQMVKADWKSRVIWIPKSICYNAPESPNVVKSWRTSWDEIPECSLKIEAHQYLKAFLEGLGEAFAKAFAEGCLAPIDRRADRRKSDPSPNQEQEQEQNTPHSPPRGAMSGSAESAFAVFWLAYPNKKGKGAARRWWARNKPDAELQKKILAAIEKQRTSAQWTKDGGRFIPHPSTWLNQERWEDEVTAEKPREEIVI